MAGLFLFVLALFAADAYPTGVEPLAYDARASLAAAACAVGLAYGAGRFAALRLGASGRSAAPSEAAGEAPDPDALARYGRGSAWGRALVMGCYAALVFLGHWPLVVQETWEAAAARILRDAPPELLALPRLPGIRHALDLVLLPFLYKLLEIAPFLLSLAAVWIGEFPGERRRRGGDLTLGAYLRFQTRSVTALALLPLLLLSAFESVASRVPGCAKALEVYPFLGTLGGAALCAGLFVIAPELLRLAWRARPIAPGRLRDRLEACCARAGFRCRGLLVWDTRGTRAVNAFIAGVAPRFRYVFFTDGLLERLRPDQVEAVLAHEIGHAACRHIRWYLALSLGYLALLAAALEWLADAWGTSDLAQLATALILFVAYWGVLFGFVSRRFESEADLYAARLIGDPMRFAETLRRVCALNGMSPTRGSWRHFSPARRVGFLLLARRLPLIEYGFHRALRRLTTLMAAGVGISLLAAWQAAAMQVEDAPRQRERLALARKAAALSDEARRLREEGHAAAAIERLLEAARCNEADPRLRRELGDALDDAGRRDEALEQYREARRLTPRELRPRQHLARKLGGD